MKALCGLVMIATCLAAFLTTASIAGGDRQDVANQQLDDRRLPESLAQLRLPSPRMMTGISVNDIGIPIFRAKGVQQVVVRLRTDSVVDAGHDSPKARRERKGTVETEQRDFLERLLEIAPEAKVLGRMRLVLNAVLLEVDTDVLSHLSSDPSVLRITPVLDYKLALSDTVPYIGASAVQDLGVDGSGVRVAVLDTGVDYTHAHLSGRGTRAAYRAAYGAGPSDPRNASTDGLFPTEKVVGGYDFVGETWPAGPLSFDPDPIDSNGHGTNVADIIGGRKGVAPGVSLYAVKVCATQAAACSGVALLLAMEFAVDPNGDGNPVDHVDIVNMSLGGNYGQPFDDELSAAVDNATKLGVLTVAASGNGGDLPYITSSPGAAASAIAVAQTHVPADSIPFMTVLEPSPVKGDYPVIFQPWSAPLTKVIQGPAQYGDGAGGNLDGCVPFAAESLEGKIVVVDRGRCFFSAKIRNIQDSGGVLGIIALVSPGLPFPGGFGGGSAISIPGFMIGQGDGGILRQGSAEVRLDPGNVNLLVGSVVDSSSRGPELQGNGIKPDLAAPGASVSAQVGTGTGESPFGGTSGATPMVTGTAALLLQGYRPGLNFDRGLRGSRSSLSPLEVKALLMNTSEVNIRNTSEGPLAPVTRIGGGEVRVDRALATPAAAWDEDGLTGSLGFGFVDVADGSVNLTKRVRLRNYSSSQITYRLATTFRFADDAANGAVTISAPPEVSVGAGEDAVFEAVLSIQGHLLRDNVMDSGRHGNDSGRLTVNEYDGYLVLDDGVRPIHLAWHVLPRKAARVISTRAIPEFAADSFPAPGLASSIKLTNTGVGVAQNDAYTLIALSPDLPRGGRGEGSPTPDIRAIGVRTFQVPAGFCSSEPSYVMVFAVNTWERQTHANFPGIYWFDLDTDRDGTPDFAVFNFDLRLLQPGVDGRNVTWAVDYSTGNMSSFFFTEHAMNTANTALTVCGEQIGSVPLFQEIDATVFAVDIFFGGLGDVVEGLTFAPLSEGFVALVADIPEGSSALISLRAGNGALRNDPGGLGLLVFTNGGRSRSNRGGATQATEALLLTPEGLDGLGGADGERTQP